MGNSLTNFLEEQEVMDNLGETLEHLYMTDSSFNLEADLATLTERTYNVMMFMERTRNDLLKDPNAIATANKYNTTVESIAYDITEIMMLSTIARQDMLLEKLVDIKGD